MIDKITLTEIHGVYTIPTSKGRYLEIKNRPTYALSFCIGEGRIVYNKDGVLTVSDRHHAVIIPKGASYTLLNEEGGDFPIINFDTTDAFTEDFMSFELSSPESFIDDFFRLERDFSASLSRARCFADFYTIISRLSRCDDENSRTVRHALKYIANNLSQPTLTNELIAKELNISEVYFRRLFARECDITPRQYILSQRVSRAKELLSEGLGSIGQISEMCGFSSVYHFSRAFKSLTGIRPSEYSGKRHKSEKSL